MRTIISKRQAVDQSGNEPNAHGLVVELLAFLASEPDRSSAFFETTGLAATSVRDRVEEPAFRRGLLDYVVSDDGLLIAFATFVGRAPERVARDIAQHRHRSDD